MTTNMSGMDRIIRLVIAIIVAVLYFNGTLTGTIGIVALVIAAIFVLTSLVSFCPIYRILGLSTCPIKK